MPGWYFAADAAVKGLLLLLLAGTVVLLMRRQSASARHLVWLLRAARRAALCALLHQPGLQPARHHRRALPAAAAIEGGSSTVDTTPLPAAGSATIALSPTIGPAVQITPGIATEPEPIPEETFTASLSFAAIVIITWTLVSAALAIRLLFGLIALARHRRGAEKFDGGRLSAATEEVRTQLGLRPMIQLYVSPQAIMPMSWGIFRGKVLLPADAHEWSDHRLRVVLLHEIGHLKRRDPLVQLLVQFTCALHWFNPLAWIAAWRIHCERERACDDLVLRCGVEPAEYAQDLLEVVAGPRRLPGAALAAVAMARSSKLESRLVAILDERQNRKTLSRPLVASTLAIGAAFVLPLSMLQAHAEPDPEPEPNTKPKPAAEDKEKSALEQLRHLQRLAVREQMLAEVEKLWEKAPQQAKPLAGAPPVPITLDHGVVLEAEGKEITASLEDRVLWKSRLDSEAVGPFMLAGDTVVVIDNSGKLSVIDVKTGKLTARHEVPTRVVPGPPPVANPRARQELQDDELVEIWAQLIRETAAASTHLERQYQST